MTNIELNRSEATEHPLINAFYSYKERIAVLNRIEAFRQKDGLPKSLKAEKEIADMQERIDALDVWVSGRLDLLPPSYSNLSDTDSIIKALQSLLSFLRKRGTEDAHLNFLYGRGFASSPTARSALDQALLDTLHRNTRSARHRERLYTTIVAAYEFERQGYYPFLLTPNCRPRQDAYVMNPDNHVWKRFMDWLNKTLKSHAKKHNLEYRKVEYCKVVELSPKRGKPHIHAILWLPFLPYGLTDPNRGSGCPNRTNVLFFFKFWSKFCDKAGYDCRAWRMGPTDAFAKAGWQWPVIPNAAKDGFVDQKAGPPEAMGGYLAKYLTKDYIRNPKNKRRLLTWSTSKAFGKKAIHKLVNLVSDETLQYLRHIKNPPWTHHGQMVPSSLIRRAANRTYMSRMFPVLGQVSIEATKWLRSTMSLPSLPGLLSFKDAMTRQSQEETLIPPDLETSGSMIVTQSRPTVDFSPESYSEANRVASECFQVATYRRSVSGHGDSHVRS